MKHDELHLWFLADPAAPRLVGPLRLIDAGKGVSLQYGADWLAHGFALSEDLGGASTSRPAVSRRLISTAWPSASAASRCSRSG